MNRQEQIIRSDFWSIHWTILMKSHIIFSLLTMHSIYKVVCSEVRVEQQSTLLSTCLGRHISICTVVLPSCLSWLEWQWTKCAVPRNICTVGHGGIVIVMLIPCFIFGKENMEWRTFAPISLWYGITCTHVRKQQIIVR